MRRKIRRYQTSVRDLDFRVTSALEQTMKLCIQKQDTFQLPFIKDRFRSASIDKQMYNDLDAGIDYGCIFTSGCFDECNKCPLCLSSKEQLVDVLSGSKRSAKG